MAMLALTSLILFTQKVRKLLQSFFENRGTLGILYNRYSEVVKCVSVTRENQ